MADCTIISLRDEDDTIEWIEELTDRDPYQVMDEAEALFKKSGIRMSSNEEYFEMCLSGDVVQGVSSLGLYDSSPLEGDPYERPQYSFSVAVLESARRKGIAKRMVQSVIRSVGSGGLLMGKVVNPNMAKLLEALGFECIHEEPEWTDEDRQIGVVMYKP